MVPQTASRRRHQESRKLRMPDRTPEVAYLLERKQFACDTQLFQRSTHATLALLPLAGSVLGRGWLPKSSPTYGGRLVATVDVNEGWYDSRESRTVCRTADGRGNNRLSASGSGSIGKEVSDLVGHNRRNVRRKIPVTARRAEDPGCTRATCTAARE